MIWPMRAVSVVRAGLVTGGLLALVGCHPVLVNVAEPGHGVIGTGVSGDLPDLSDDGNVVSFVTSDYLTAEDHQGTWDTYVRDLRRRDTALMSVTPDGGQDGCGVTNPAISGDGRYVAWSACSGYPNTPPPPGTVGTNVFVKDRVTGELEQIGIPEHLQMPGGGWGFLDKDGSHIVIWCFPTSAEVPVSVCLQDRRTGDTTVVARRTDGQIVQAFVTPASISDDGRLVAFIAPFADVVPGSSDTRQQLFVRDVAAGVTTPVTIDPSVLSGDLGGLISGDGTAAVVWQTAPPYHIVHKDLVTGAVHRVDQAQCRNVAPSPTYALAAISDDGDVVAFQSGSEALVPDDTNGHDDVFVWRAKVPCMLQRVSLGPGLREGDGHSYWPAVSGDGSTIAFVSEATNMVRDDTNGAPDAFVVTLAPGLP
jgi:Tol biopolymer transport system component